MVSRVGRGVKNKTRRSAQLTIKLDKENVEALKRCLEKGTLTITISSIDKKKGERTHIAYLYG